MGEKQLLLAEIFSPLVDVTCEELFASLQTSVEWMYGEDMRSAVKWVYSVDRYRFIVLIDDKDITRKLASKEFTELQITTLLAEYHSIKVFLRCIMKTTAIPSLYLLLVAKSGVSGDIPSDTLSALTNFLPHPSTSHVYYRSDSIILKLTSATCCRRASNALADLPSVETCEPLSPTNYCFLEASWKDSSSASDLGQLPVRLETIVSRLAMRGDSLLGFIQNFLSLLEDQACVIDVSILTDGSNYGDGDRVLFVCATIADARILLNADHGIISVGMLGTFVFHETKVSATGMGRVGMKIGINFDDLIETVNRHVVLLDSISSLAKISDKEDSNISSSAPNHNIFELFNRRKMMLSFLRDVQDEYNCGVLFVKLYDDVDMATLYRPVNFGAAIRCVLVGYYDKYDAFCEDMSSIWKYMQASYPLECEQCGICGSFPTKYKSIFSDCIVTKEKNYAEVTEVENIDNIMERESKLDLNFVNIESSLCEDCADGDGNGTFLFGGKNVNDRKEDAFATSANNMTFNMRDTNRGLADNINKQKEITMKYDKPSDHIIVAKDNGISKIADGRYTKTIRIAKFSLAQYLSQALDWNVEGHNLLDWDEHVQQDGDPMYDLISLINDFGCSIEMLIDKNKRKQKALLFGSTVSMLRKLSLAVCDVISLLRTYRKVLRLSNSWKPEHREAFMDSIPLLNKIRLFSTIAVFHLADNSVVVELVGASCSGIKKMKAFLYALHPRFASWSFPVKSVDQILSSNFWIMLNHHFGVFTTYDVEYKNDGMKFLKVNAHGFDDSHLLADAHKLISRAAEGDMEPFGQRNSCELHACETGVQGQCHGKKYENNRPEMVDRKFSSKNNSLTSRVERCTSNPVISVFKFNPKDRYASHLFSCYEDVFKRFFLRKYDVVVNCFCNTLPSSCKTENTSHSKLLAESSSNADREQENDYGRLCMLDLRGKTSSAVNSVKYYLSHMSERLSVQRISFKSVSEIQYQKIVRAKQYGTGSFISNDRPSSNSATVDPLEHVQLLSLLIEPPLFQLSGNRKYQNAFPIDVTVVVCSPHAAIKNKPKFESLVESFYALKRAMLLDFDDVELDAEYRGISAVDKCTLQKEYVELEQVERHCTALQLKETCDQYPSHTLDWESKSSGLFEAPHALERFNVSCSIKYPFPMKPEEYHHGTFSDISDISLSGNSKSAYPSSLTSTSTPYRIGISSHVACNIPDDISCDTRKACRSCSFNPNTSSFTLCESLGSGMVDGGCSLCGVPNDVDDVVSVTHMIDGINCIIDDTPFCHNVESRFVDDSSHARVSSNSEALLTPPLYSKSHAVSNIQSAEKSELSKVTVNDSVYQRTVHWPHPSFRYMFLSDHMRNRIQVAMSAVHHKYHGEVQVTCPYRDKKDSSVCLLISAVPKGSDGTSRNFVPWMDRVDATVLLFDRVLHDTLNETETTQLLLRKDQFDFLTGDSLVTVKNIQGNAGVHVILPKMSTPSPSGNGNLMNEKALPQNIPCCTLDLREKSMLCADLCDDQMANAVEGKEMKMWNVGCSYQATFSCKCGGDGGTGRDVLVVQFPHCSRQSDAAKGIEECDRSVGLSSRWNVPIISGFSTIEIAVQKNNGGAGWLWGPCVDSLFAIVDASDAEYLNDEEKLLLSYGDILMTKECSSGNIDDEKIIFRGSPPKFQVEDERQSVDFVVHQLQSLVSRAISRADSVTEAGGRRKGLAIVPPVSHRFFSKFLSPTDIGVLCLQAACDYVLIHPPQFLHRVVCLEAPETVSYDGGSMLAKSLFLRVKTVIEEAIICDSAELSQLPFLSDCCDVDVLKMIQKWAYDVKGESNELKNCFSDFLKRKDIAHGVIYSSEIHDYDSYDTKAVQVRGTPRCLVSAVKLIMTHLKKQKDC